MAELLPQQGPISVFVHHNTLHAFEDLPFEEAVVAAGEQLGCEPFLSSQRYRDEIGRGRIRQSDVADVIRGELGDEADAVVAAGLTRQAIRFAITVHGMPTIRSEPLRWILSETPALSRFRADAVVRGVEDEPAAVRSLWEACIAAKFEMRAPRLQVGSRPRDAVREATGIDTDEWVHPVLIRFVSAYLDQGMARHPMPGREAGMRACFHDLYGSNFAAQALGEWSSSLATLVAADRDASSGEESIQASLEALEVPHTGWRNVLTETALALRGWAGMVHQFEARPDRIPAVFVPARLADFLAVGLLLERAALAHIADRVLVARAQPPEPTDEERAWPLFQLAQLCGLDAAAVNALAATEVAALAEEMARFDDVARRRVLHIAYERELRSRYYDALLADPPRAVDEAPAYQAIFCIDEREESMRRHLEEADPEVETYGAAGFFGVAMYFRGVNEAHPRALCPVVIKPRHFVAEVAESTHVVTQTWRRAQQVGVGAATQTTFVGGRSPVVGALLSIAGVFALVPLVLRVLFPRLGKRLEPAALLSIRSTRIEIERSEAVPPIGEWSGFTVEEMADIVGTLLRGIGVADRLAPLVFVMGHGSSSLNNPQESAYDCGACAGAHGGPNARVFAAMANDPRVRDILRGRGIVVPDDTWFVGGERNTCTNAVLLFDEEKVPTTTRALFRRGRDAFDRAREAEAHERARRFESVPTWVGPKIALMQVESRGVDLAQPRPEAGHATNAAAFIGRRTRTSHLFLDRRAFLVSYDSTTDSDGEVLAGLLRAVVPVIVGINLEYFFGYVDPIGYGCGTKLPHNIAAMVGVMDGAQSDLRTGLTWQMVELHEPVRLTMVVEADRAVFERVVANDAQLHRLAMNRWLYVACLDPEDQALWEFRDDELVRQGARSVAPTVHGASLNAYDGLRGHLPFSRLTG